MQRTLAAVPGVAAALMRRKLRRGRPGDVVAAQAEVGSLRSAVGFA